MNKFGEISRIQSFKFIGSPKIGEFSFLHPKYDGYLTLTDKPIIKENFCPQVMGIIYDIGAWSISMKRKCDCSSFDLFQKGCTCGYLDIPHVEGDVSVMYAGIYLPKLNVQVGDRIYMNYRNGKISTEKPEYGQLVGLALCSSDDFGFTKVQLTL